MISGIKIAAGSCEFSVTAARFLDTGIAGRYGIRSIKLLLEVAQIATITNFKLSTM